MNDRTVASGRWRWRPSLRLSLQLVLLATVVLPAVVVVLVGQRLAREQQAEVLAEGMQSVMVVGSASLTEPLWAINLTAVELAVQRLLDNPIVVGVRVTEDRPGQPRIERYRHPHPQGLPPDLAIEGVVLRSEAILHEGKSLGRLDVWFDTRLGAASLTERRNQLMGVVLLQTVLSLLVLGLFLSHRVIRPIERLKARASAMTQRDAPPPLTDPGRHDEIGELERHLQRVHGELHASFEALDEKHRQLEHMALYDALTGLPNRRLFRDHVEREIGRAAREPLRFGLLFLDIDRFKTVNDALGHTLGDQLLMEVARRLRGCLRDIDVVCRHSGDEFMLLVRDVQNWEEIAAVSERLLAAFDEPVRLGDAPTRVSVSAGVALFPDDARDFETLVKHADVAMYQAKAQGRARYSFFHPELNAQRQASVLLEQQLGAALERHEFELFYQPQVEARSGRLHGCEVLLRWHHPTRGVLAPGEFIAIAEESGRIADIGLWVRHEACRQLAEWTHQGIAPGVVAVNVSALEFRDHRLLDSLREALADSGVAPGQLEIEITESALMTDTETTLRIIERVRELGVRLAVDDFGTGYSSLAYLKRVRPQLLKIDRSFVRDIGTDADDRAIVRGVIELAHALGMDVLAEGVEEPQQRDYLRDSGCRLLQGYLIARPMTAAAFTAWMRAHAAAAPATATPHP